MFISDLTHTNFFNYCDMINISAPDNIILWLYQYMNVNIHNVVHISQLSPPPLSIDA